MSFGQLTQLQERVLAAINHGVQQTHNHALKLVDNKAPCSCDQCGGLMTGNRQAFIAFSLKTTSATIVCFSSFRQSYKCSACGIHCHLGCMNHLLTLCEVPVCNLRVSYKCASFSLFLSSFFFVTELISSAFFFLSCANNQIYRGPDSSLWCLQLSP